MNSQMIAVSWTSFEKSGCVNCGCEYCFSQGIQGRGTSPVTCGECKTDFVVLADGLTKSSFGFGNPSYYPEIATHPRIHIPKHKYIRPDVRPEGEGEFWNPRGVGYDLSGFVKSREAGERIIKMIQTIIGKNPDSFLDYREHEPNWIQVKIQKEDGFDLAKLCNLCKEDGIINKNRLSESLLKR